MNKGKAKGPNGILIEAWKSLGEIGCAESLDVIVWFRWILRL